MKETHGQGEYLVNGFTPWGCQTYYTYVHPKNCVPRDNLFRYTHVAMVATATQLPVCMVILSYH